MVLSNFAIPIPQSPIKNGVYIGTSGYNYPHWWNDVFFPSDLPQRKWLEFYAEYFDTVELNVSFYRLPKKESFEGWYKKTPKGFTFAVKGSRFITHIKRLKDCREPLSILLDHSSPLKEKLGIMLWQLPPRFRFQKERLEEFCVLLSTLPRAKRLRHAFEFRDESWLCDEVFRILKEFNFAFCIAHGSGLPLMETMMHPAAPKPDFEDGAKRRGSGSTPSKPWPLGHEVEWLTSDCIYLRLHGGEILYGSNYSDKELRQWAEKIKDWKRKGKTIFVYFNNDAYGFAVRNGLTLKKLVDLH
jgi:uncharacterized protein YecE (DUF72 family)